MKKNCAQKLRDVKLTGTNGDVGSVTGNLTLSSKIGGNLLSDMLVFGKRISFTDSSAALGEDLGVASRLASMPSPASLVGDGIRCLTTEIDKSINFPYE